MTSKSRRQTRRGWRADGWPPLYHNQTMAVRKVNARMTRRLEELQRAFRALGKVAVHVTASYAPLAEQFELLTRYQRMGLSK